MISISSRPARLWYLIRRSNQGNVLITFNLLYFSGRLLITSFDPVRHVLIRCSDSRLDSFSFGISINFLLSIPPPFGEENATEHLDLIALLLGSQIITRYNFCTRTHAHEGRGKTYETGIRGFAALSVSIYTTLR